MRVAVEASGDPKYWFVTMAYGLSNMESFLPNPWVRDSGRKRTDWHQRLGEESYVKFVCFRA